MNKHLNQKLEEIEYSIEDIKRNQKPWIKYEKKYIKNLLKQKYLIENQLKNEETSANTTYLENQ